MSNSVAPDEDWSIISSSSDFEDETVSEVSVREDSGNSTPSDNASVTNDIDESTCTIQNGVNHDDSGQNDDKTSNENSTLGHFDTESSSTFIVQPCAIINVPEPLTDKDQEHDRVEEQNVETDGQNTQAHKQNAEVKDVVALGSKEKSKCASDCGVVRAATMVFATFYCVDQYIRFLSRKLFGPIWAKPLRSLKRDVAAAGTLNIPLYKHAIYLVLSTLERNQDFLLYYMAASAGLVVTFNKVAPAPVVESSSYSSRLQLLWMQTMYEPEETGFGRFFHAAKPKQLKAARYMSGATTLASRLVDDSYKFLLVKSDWVESRLALLLSTRFWVKSSENVAKFSTWMSDTRLRFVFVGERLAAKVLSQTGPVEQTLLDGWNNVSTWLVSTMDATQRAFDKYIVPSTEVVSAHAAHWLGEAKQVSAAWIKNYWLHTKQVSLDFEIQLRPFTQYVVQQSHSIFEKARLESQVAAINANRFLAEWRNVSTVYGQKAWYRAQNVIKDWHLADI